MLVYTYELFRERKDILALWQKQYPYILIDEFQDINKLQFEIVKMMALPHNNLLWWEMMTSLFTVSVVRNRN